MFFFIVTLNKIVQLNSYYNTLFEVVYLSYYNRDKIKMEMEEVT